MYQECINYHVRNVRNEKTGELLSEGTQDLRAKELKEFCEFVTQPLTAENLEITLADYEQLISCKLNKETLKRRIKNARKFAEAITKGDIIMNENATDTQGQANETASPDIQTVNAPEDTKENNTVNEPENNSNGTNNKKSGRKKIYGDREKLTLYISKELANAISCISKAKNISMSNYAVNILEQEISKKKEVLEELLKLEKEKEALQEKL